MRERFEIEPTHPLKGTRAIAAVASMVALLLGALVLVDPRSSNAATRRSRTPDAAKTTKRVKVKTTRHAARPGPELLFADVESGPTSGGPGRLGVPISLFGRGFGSVRGASKVTIGGVEVASYLTWGSGNAANPALDTVTVQPGPNVRDGELVVWTDGVASNPLPFRRGAGAFHWIARNGSDANACTEAAPCASVQHVVSTKVRAGDTVLIRGGTYDESEIWIRGDQGKSGTATSRITVKAHPNEVVTFANAARPMIVNADFITVSGLRFENGKSVTNGSNEAAQRGNWLIGNTFRGIIGYDATGSHGDDHVLAGNDCTVTSSTVGTQGHCYYISFGNNVKVRYNVGSGAPGYGVHVFDQQRATNDFRRVISNLLIEGNTLTGSTRRAGLIVAMGDEGNRGNVIDGVDVRSNTFSGNDQLGAVIGPNVRNVTFTGNSFVQNGSAGLYVGGGALTRDVIIRANTFEQSANNVCKVECTWYRLAHVTADPAVRGVVVDGNRYLPGPPIVEGAVDAHPLGAT